MPSIMQANFGPVGKRRIQSKTKSAMKAAYLGSRLKSRSESIEKLPDEKDTPNFSSIVKLPYIICGRIGRIGRQNAYARI